MASENEAGHTLREVYTVVGGIMILVVLQHKHMGSYVVTTW